VASSALDTPDRAEDTAALAEIEQILGRALGAQNVYSTAPRESEPPTNTDQHHAEANQRIADATEGTTGEMLT
jgi:hypothetical protein